MTDDLNVAWVDQYTPQQVDDCILPKRLKKTFKGMVESGHIDNMIFSGTQGLGKTSTGKAIARELGADLLFINASEESGIDMIRGKIKQFASTYSMEEKPKIILLDEADYLNPQSSQPALRALIEEHLKTCRFILTCNYLNRIIAPLHSRCTPIHFKIPKGEQDQLMVQVYKTISKILEDNDVSFEKGVVASFIKSKFPDIRGTINSLQVYAKSGGVIDDGILLNANNAEVEKLFRLMKARKFNDVRKWVTENSISDPATIFRTIFELSGDNIENKSIPQLVVTLSDYQKNVSVVADQEINMLACFTEIMSDCEFK